MAANSTTLHFTRSAPRAIWSRLAHAGGSECSYRQRSCVLANTAPASSRAASQVATPAGATSKDLGLTAAALLPPLQLLRRILRGHRKYLDADQRSLGDAYVKAEFSRHRNVDQPLQIVAFLAEWKKYLDQLELQDLEGGVFKGRQLDADKFNKLSDEQLYQLHEFMTAAREVYDPLKAKGQPPGGAKTVQEAVDGALKRVREEQEKKTADKKRSS